MPNARHGLVVAHLVASFVASAVPAAAQEAAVATPVRVIDTSAWGRPSPDPSGVAAVPGTGRLLVADGEVDETPRYRGRNVWRITRSGAVEGGFDTAAFSDEPTGVATGRGNRNLAALSDDGADRIWFVRRGPDRRWGTRDDRVRSLSTRGFGSGDPEGVAIGAGTLVVADGADARLYRIGRGPNRRFDGLPPDGDDRLLGMFDTAVLGLADPEGVDVDPMTGHVFVVSRSDDVIAEITLTGDLVRRYDIEGSGVRRPAGIGVVRPPRDPTLLLAYVADRGVDNDSDPDENDGAIHVFRLET
jgi:DNA-binding beta-propeller fold protein YncE